MPPLSPVGIFHTLFGVIALVSAAYSFIKYGEIRSSNRSSQIYLATTLLTAITALTIFRHGGFNAAHGLAILTVAAVVVGFLLERTNLLRSLTRYIVALSYGASVLFHLLPTATEFLTRFPIGAPRVSSLQDPLLQQTFAIIAAIWAVFMMIQLVMFRLRRQAS